MMTRKRFLRAGAAAALVLAAAAACSHAFRQPTVELTGVKLGGIGIQGGLLYADLRVDNPNGYDLKANGLSYDLQLRDPDDPQGWVPVSRGTYDEEVKVPARGQALVEIPVEFSYAGANAAVRSVLSRGTFTYKVSGTVGVKEPIETTVPYHHQGVITMQGAQ